MEKPSVLVVDDEQDLCEIIKFNLEAKGYLADIAYSAEDALKKDLIHFDLILLDVMMPGMSGFDLARRIKSSPSLSSIPLIFLSAKDAEDDIVKGFDIGADDYIPKPFSIRELMARIKAVLARIPSSKSLQTGVITIGGLTIDINNMRVVVDGQDVQLTRTEYELLITLASQPRRVFSREQLIEKVWPKDVVVSNRTVDVNIARMRKKIGNYSSFVVAHTGFGYSFEI